MQNILLGISGGIAAYKSAELVRLLRQQGFAVMVVMTESAQQFVTPLTFQALSGNPVHTDLLDPNTEAGMGHIELARWADLILIAPATADLIARLAGGHANDLLTTVCLASVAPLAVAPAMNQAMWLHKATEQNVRQLRDRGVMVWGPDSGEQACGDLGPGRMLQPVELLELIDSQRRKKHVLKGYKVVITAGPTRETIDPVRYLSNHSSGKMGYALAEAAAACGADVHLVSGPTNLRPPEGVTTYAVESAEQMLSQCLNVCSDADIFIGAAAVADFCVATPAQQKIKKQDQESYLTLTLIKNPDVLAHIAVTFPSLYTVGFAAETENVLANAQHKLIKKKVAMILANDVSNPDIGFNSDQNAITAVTLNKSVEFSQKNKLDLSYELVALIAQECAIKNKKMSVNSRSPE